MNNPRQVEFHRLQLDLASFDGGEFQDASHQRQQFLRRGVSQLHILPLLLVEIGRKQEFVHAHHTVEGRADLMVDVGEKGSLCPRRLVGQIPGSLESLGLGGTGRHVVEHDRPPAEASLGVSKRIDLAVVGPLAICRYDGLTTSLGMVLHDPERAEYILGIPPDDLIGW